MEIKLKVPYFKQTLEYSCFPASVKMVLSYYGLEFDEVELYNKTKRQRFCWEDKMAEFLLEKGFKVTIYFEGDTLDHVDKKTENEFYSKLKYLISSKGLIKRENATLDIIKDFLKNKTPVLAEVDADKLYKKKYDMTHMLVIYGFDNEKFYIRDPFDQGNKKISYDDFKKCWEKIKWGERFLFIIEKNDKIQK
jgi:ABC-type bacteriocin/lantibiotic exporter with double-glycine peptidase domain